MQHEKDTFDSRRGKKATYTMRTEGKGGENLEEWNGAFSEGGALWRAWKETGE